MKLALRQSEIIYNPEYIVAEGDWKKEKEEN